jgi:hypothetical protein
MDIPHHIGQKFYPFSHFIGYRPADYAQRTIFMSKFRERAWVKKTENVLLSVVGAWVALTLLGKHSKFLHGFVPDCHV